MLCHQTFNGSEAGVGAARALGWGLRRRRLAPEPLLEEIEGHFFRNFFVILIAHPSRLSPLLLMGKE